MNRLTLLMASMLSLCTTVMAHGAETINFDENWKFAFGNAADPAKDFGCGTEYFNYLTKAASIHNEGPYSPKFDPAKWDNEWKEVNLPHDWVVDLPFSPDASHSHGYKTVGYKYPETSVGWYRKVFSLPADDLGRHLSLRFDGIFRDARVWVNGFYLGSEPSGYASQVYDISEYLNYGGDNVIAVRADASLEEGWFYEGAGIYRHVWLEKTDPLHVAPFGTFVHSSLAYPYDTAEVTIETTVDNKGNTPASYELRHRLIAPDGSVAATASASETGLLAKESRRSISGVTVSKPMLWDVDSPHLYKLVTEVVKDGSVVDCDTVVTGIRDARFDPDKGFLLNNRPLKLKGVNMHQDHAGVGAAIPDALQAYRLRELKKFGVNAYRSSHNPMTPEMLDACDSLGILVLEENRLSGINDEHVRLLKRMIERDRNHPSIIVWSVGNEEWGIEWNEFGNRISESMREYCHRFDPTRPMCFATSGGPTVVVPADVAGYNYIMQNPVEQHRRDYPSRIALGSEETTGCGTRGIYFDDRDNGRMASLNRSPNGSDSILNCIGRGWRFYADRPWLAGLFYWTGFDYRGEPNPLKFPATGSEFGILDYCGFPKDEAFYLKSWWTDEPVLHILPHWNLHGHEGEPVQIWVYSNMDEVELAVNGKSLGRKTMPRNGHLAWDAVYQPGKVTATGYKNGKKAMTAKVETSGAPAKINAAADRQLIKADNHDVAVVNITLSDSKKRFVPDGCVTLDLTVDGPVRILGVGNGDPAWQDAERPADPMSRTFKVKTFNGMAQVILQAAGNEAATATLAVSSEGLQPATVSVDVR
ncbi:glycoside hydrolase family 2 protein [Barnesiella sp. WM24]|nr:beta-galactosidase GalA [Barnesiella sp. WM24]TFU93038.1 glycoside hydrolase family 2 protein [Barnesiella sp. WM24]